jgi:SNF2 family DNA or RNA helicase
MYLHLEIWVKVINCFKKGFYLDEILNSGIITPIFYKSGGISQIELPDFERLVSDCAKLKKLDELLNHLKRNNHRVLIFCQVL